MRNNSVINRLRRYIKVVDNKILLHFETVVLTSIPVSNIEIDLNIVSLECLIQDLTNAGN